MRGGHKGERDMGGKFIQITGEAGETFRAYKSVPRSGDGPAVIVLPEIFGINQHVRDVADFYAEEGYVALAPDVFWRVENTVRAQEGLLAACVCDGGLPPRHCGMESVQASIVDDLDHGSKAMLLQLRCWCAGQRAIAEEKCTIVGFYSAQSSLARRLPRRTDWVSHAASTHS
jgi:dienelactone hydrolase